MNKKFLVKNNKFLSSHVVEFELVEKSPSGKYWKVIHKDSKDSTPFWVEISEFEILESLDTPLDNVKIDPVNIELV